MQEFRESSSVPHLTHPLTLPKPLSASPELGGLRDGRDVGKAASVAECGGGLEKFLRLYYNFVVDPTRRPR